MAKPDSELAKFFNGFTTERIKTSGATIHTVYGATATVRRCFSFMVFRKRTCSGARSRRRWHMIILS
jgi:hypothetical protein